MKKNIQFEHWTAQVDRTGDACGIKFVPSKGVRVSALADQLEVNPEIKVLMVFPTEGMMLLTAEKTFPNSSLIDAICDAISEVYDCDTTLTNERPESAV